MGQTEPQAFLELAAIPIAARVFDQPIERQMSQNDMPEGGGIVGFLFGVIFAVVILGASLAWLDTPWPLGVTIAIAIGLLAYRFGDRFWTWLLRHP